MAHGKTQEMIDLTKSFRWRRLADRPTRERDRSLRGKARRKARRTSSTP